MPVRITVYDGATCIGGSKIHLQADGTGLFLDFGLNYSRWGRYYEEYLKPRSSRGLVDILALGIVPPLGGFYREDLFPADLSVDLPLRVQCDAILVSHPHLDHCGHLGLVRPDIPIYASTMTAMLIKAIQDSGRSDFDRQMAYFAPRQSVDPAGRMLKASDWKKVPLVGREFRTVDEEPPHDSAQSFWLTPPNPTGRGRKLETTPLSPALARVGSLRLRAFPVDHSILGATAFALETSQGWIAYTGDFRLHGQRGDATRAFVEEMARLRPLALITEGTNVPRGRRTSEREAHDNCSRAVLQAEGKLVVADFAARNIERLLAFLDIARRARRRLAILAKDAYLLHAARLADQAIPDLMADESLAILEDLRASPDKWEAELIKKLYGGKYVSAQEVSRSQGDYVLALSFWDMKHLLDIKPVQGSIYVYSTSEAYTEEQEIDAWRLWNWLTFLGMRAVGFSVPPTTGRRALPEPSFVPGFHSSGHISGDELLEVIRAINPRYLIPVHTEHPEFFAQELRGEIQVILPVEGQPIVL